MDIVGLLPRLRFLRLPVGHVYLWEDPDGLTLVDSGLPGTGRLIAHALQGMGHAPQDVKRLVLTHFHEDHAGSAAEIATWGAVEVCAHRADAPFVRGEAQGPEAVLEAWERPVWDQVHAAMGPVDVPPVRVDRELEDGDVLDFGGGAHVLSVPGHTPGSIALHLPAEGVLFTGDSIARGPDGVVRMGVFNVDAEAAAASLRQQSALDVEIACFGHGEPATRHTASELRAAADGR